MIPVVTPDEMRAADAAAPEPVEVLVERAGSALARAALAQLGGTYGRRVVVVAGKGNNGADGRAAAVRLARRGIHVRVVDAADAPSRLPAADLVVDAAYGTGFRGDYRAPHPGDAFVLACDIPSGVDGLTGVAGPDAVWADATVTFAALKPGVLLADGAVRAGLVEVADIGLDVGAARAHLVTDGDVFALLPPRRRDAHKYASAVLVVAGSPGMLGAARLTATAALRAGAGYVRLAVPGAAGSELPVGEAVGRPLPEDDWGEQATAELARMTALAIGPGLGRSAGTATAVRRVLSAADVPAVVDGDGLAALGTADDAAGLLRSRPAPTLLTPHDGEYAALAGAPPGPDRLDATRRLAAATGATVLLKGPTTIVAAPDGRALFVTTGTPRLATAGTGDVLTGIAAALLASGVPALEAGAAAAHAHGGAARLGPVRGLVAGDLLELLPVWLSGGGARA